MMKYGFKDMVYMKEKCSVSEIGKRFTEITEKKRKYFEKTIKCKVED